MRQLSPFVSDDFSLAYREFCTSVKSSRTVDEYTGYINLICNYLCCDFIEIDGAAAGRFFSHLKEKCVAGKLSKHTVAVRLSCYRAVSNYICSTEMFPGYVNPFEYIKRPETENEVYADKVPSLRELDTFIGTIKNDYQLSLIFALTSRIGMSATDIISIKHEMIQRLDDGRYCIVYPPKTNFDNPRIVTLPEDVSELLCRFLSCNEFGAGHIFYNKGKRPMTIRNVDSYFSKAYKESGLEKTYTLKDFRTRAILELAKAGVGIDKICEYTGLSALRAQAYVNSVHIINEDCPASLVNYRLVVGEPSQLVI